jgi:hypothetical protein
VAVSVAINGNVLNPQPADVDWEVNIIEQKLNGTDGSGAYQVVTLRAPVDRGTLSNWNWGTYANSVLSSIVLPPPYSTMRDTGTTYSSGVVSRAIRKIENPPGGLIRGVELQILVIV